MDGILSLFTSIKDCAVEEEEVAATDLIISDLTEDNIEDEVALLYEDLLNWENGHTL